MTELKGIIKGKTKWTDGDNNQFQVRFPPNPERASLVSFIVHTPSISLTKKKEKPSIPNLRFVIFIIFFPKILSITVY